MKKVGLLILSTVLILTLSGCIRFQSDDVQQGAQGGVFKSNDQGLTWAPIQTISSPLPQKESIEGINVTTIVSDPQDNNAIYVGSETRGLFYSYDGGIGWNQFATFNTGHVRSIAVHPQNKCTIFASINNRILQSNDCSRTWQQVYFDPRTDAIIYTLAIDNFDPMIMYAGTGYGDVLKSEDGGMSWRTVHRVNTQIVQILIGPDTRTVYVGTPFNGIYKTTDKGQTWTQIVDTIYNAGLDPGNLTNMAFDYKNNVLIVSSLYGLIQTEDGGDTWTGIPLITAPNEVQVHSLAVNPENANEIFYGTDTTFYKTIDRGQNWIPQQLPTASKAQRLLVDPTNMNTLYLGFKKFQE